MAPVRSQIRQEMETHVGWTSGASGPGDGRLHTPSTRVSGACPPALPPGVWRAPTPSTPRLLGRSCSEAAGQTAFPRTPSTVRPHEGSPPERRINVPIHRRGLPDHPVCSAELGPLLALIAIITGLALDLRLTTFGIALRWLTRR
jgi:hypothetical protein